MKIYNSLTDLIGNTPMLKISNYSKINNINAKLFAKLEYFNPAGSVKDRVAMNIIATAEANGTLNKNTTIIEPTSGNTGIGLAAICASKGYKLIITMPETMSVERRKLMTAYGAELVLTDGKKGMAGAIEKAEELNKTIENSIIAGQFENEANPQAHINTTGPEIWNDLDGKVDIFVACIGTGGTITGISKFLKSKNPDIKIIGIEPADSPVLTKGVAGPHKIQGIGAGFVPKVLDTNAYDEIITITNDDAFNSAREFCKTEGVLVGISSGAAIHGGTMVAKRPENADKNIVILLPDTGERYLSTELF